MINEAVRKSNEEKLLLDMKKYSKLKEKVTGDFERQPYFDNKKVVEARTMFRINSGTFPCKMNN